MTDVKPPIRLMRAISVRVTCMIHGSARMHGGPRALPLGHGNTYQTTGDAQCDGCQSDVWLHLEIYEEEVHEVDPAEYGAAQMTALEEEIGTPEPEEEEVADEGRGNLPASVSDLEGTQQIGPIEFGRRRLGS